MFHIYAIPALCNFHLRGREKAANVAENESSIRLQKRRWSLAVLVRIPKRKVPSAP